MKAVCVLFVFWNQTLWAWIANGDKNILTDMHTFIVTCTFHFGRSRFNNEVSETNKVSGEERWDTSGKSEDWRCWAGTRVKEQL